MLSHDESKTNKIRRTKVESRTYYNSQWRKKKTSRFRRPENPMYRKVI